MMSWFLRPWQMGRCSFESLKDGTLDIADIAYMNYAIDVQHENEWRARQAMKDKN
jgi:hypothetical protein